MALKPCPECGKSVSTKAVSCPNCGYELVPSFRARYRRNSIGCLWMLGVIVMLGIIAVVVVMATGH
jgi:predicted nucleic acid-binding Zn ribbon protein